MVMFHGFLYVYQRVNPATTRTPLCEASIGAVGQHFLRFPGFEKTQWGEEMPSGVMAAFNNPGAGCQAEQWLRGSGRFVTENMI